jgi:transcriptional regulator with PAS, ATPase and Fis domain
MATVSEPILGASAGVLRLKQEIQYAARADSKVLITGESGSGKELVARSIHNESSRSAKPFVAINCAGIPETLLESELFGHVRGSFTGAFSDRPGLLELGHTGTVFLDEVAEMSLRMQGLLLRFLETGELQRIGADRAPRCVDVRIVAATNRPLAQEVEQGRFRSDLYYRLNVIRLAVPALRERREDVPLLLTCYLQRYATKANIPTPVVTPEALDRLMAYSWPGNVRELKNVAERLVVRRSEVIDLAALPSEVVSALPLDTSAGTQDGPRQSRVEVTLDALLSGRASFWSIVYDPFMSRDLTRDDLRAIVRNGLDQTRGSYTALVQLFNMDPADYKRFLNFLRKHQCHMPFQSFRVPPNRTAPVSATPSGKVGVA